MRRANSLRANLEIKWNRSIFNPPVVDTIVPPSITTAKRNIIDERERLTSPELLMPDVVAAEIVRKTRSQKPDKNSLKMPFDSTR